MKTVILKLIILLHQIYKKLGRLGKMRETEYNYQYTSAGKNDECYTPRVILF